MRLNRLLKRRHYPREIGFGIARVHVARAAVVVGRPGSDWFESVGAWLRYALWGAAVVLAVIGLGTAAFGAGPHVRARLVAAGVSGVTLALPAFLVWVIADTLSHVS